ncbi:hypothetical protein Tco_0570899 [Tanacetum coccineum]
MIACSIFGRGQAPEKVIDVDLFYLRNVDRGTANVPHLLAHDEGLRGLQVVTRELLLINLHELGRLNICSRYGDTWAWVAQGLDWQQVAAASAHGADTASLAADEGAQDIPAPAQAPPPPLPTPQPWTISQKIKRIEEEMCDLRHDVTRSCRELHYRVV